MAVKRDAVSSFERQKSAPKRTAGTTSYSSPTTVSSVSSIPSTPAKQKQGTSWGVIILLLVIFFPVGIGLAISKLHKEPENYEKNGKNVFIVGIVFAVLAFLYLVGGSDTTFAFVVFAIAGAAMIWQGLTYTKLAKNYEKYRSVLVNSTDGSIDNIAAALGLTYDQAVSDLGKLVAKGLLPDSYVSQEDRTFVSPLLQKSFNAYSSEIPYREETGTVRSSSQTSQVKTIKCPNCGGINTVNINFDNICDFCGSPLE